jgi:uncharacterized phage-associated protein
MSIEYQLHPMKAVEAAAMFLRLHGKPMQYMGLLKLLYMADRIALMRMEQPITGDRYSSMKFGPVLSSIYDLIKGKQVNGALPIWDRFISRSGYEVSLKGNPGSEELCEEEEDIISEVYQSCGHYDGFVLADLTHDFPEWQKPIPESSAIPLPVESILKSVGKSDREIEEIQKEAARERYLDGVLNG